MIIDEKSKAMDLVRKIQKIIDESDGVIDGSIKIFDLSRYGKYLIQFEASFKRPLL